MSEYKQCFGHYAALFHEGRNCGTCSEVYRCRKTAVEPPLDCQSKPDPVNHPAHYTQGGIECIDAITAATAGLNGIDAVCTGNAIKYLWRWKQKGGAQDLEKARWYINRMIESGK